MAVEVAAAVAEVEVVDAVALEVVAAAAGEASAKMEVAVVVVEVETEVETEVAEAVSEAMIGAVDAAEVVAVGPCVAEEGQLAYFLFQSTSISVTNCSQCAVTCFFFLLQPWGPRPRPQQALLIFFDIEGTQLLRVLIIGTRERVKRTCTFFHNIVKHLPGFHQSCSLSQFLPIL